jgi:hypothetical protein
MLPEIFFIFYDFPNASREIYDYDLETRQGRIFPYNSQIQCVKIRFFINIALNIASLNEYLY